MTWKGIKECQRYAWTTASLSAKRQSFLMRGFMGKSLQSRKYFPSRFKHILWAATSSKVIYNLFIENLRRKKN